MHRAVNAPLAIVAVLAMASVSSPASAANHSIPATTVMVDATNVTPMSFYVAPGGDDASLCTAIDLPCLTVSGAVTRAQTAIAEGAVDVIVHIAAGTYIENVNIGAVASGHSLSLVGTGAATTVIDGSATAPASVITVESGVVSIERLSVTGGNAPSGGGVYNATGILTISDAAVTSNTATASTTFTGGGGIYNDSGTVTISDSTVSNNAASGTGNTNASGGGGGIYNGTGTFTISDSSVFSNTTGASGSFKGGGGIYNATGTLNILHSEVSNNASTGTGNAGGIFGLDGGTITISDSAVSNNTASYYVGGINSRGMLSIARSTVSNNTTQRNYGGGISNYTGTLILTDSTLANNSATGSTSKGGAIYNRGTATVINSTLFGNSAPDGGGIHNFGNGNHLTLTNSTLADNSATKRGGGLRLEGGTIAVSNSIISGSSCDSTTAISDGGYNVSDTCTFHVPNETSITGSTTIGLAPLADNGSTGPQSMAIDSTSSAHHLVPGCTGVDARGMARPGFGGTANCDAGAYELQGVAPTVIANPQSQTLAIGTDATFTSTASGMPTPTVQWQASTGTAWTDVPDATDTTLVVTSVTHAMSGTQYRSVFTNGVGADVTTTAATLTVPVGALDYLVMSPLSGTIDAGGSQLFTAEGFDSFDNSLGDVTATTVFTGSAGLQCTEATCTSNVPGTHTVSGANGAATGSATVTVAAIPEVILPPNKPVATGSLTDVPSTTHPGARFTATATGFAPYAPVEFGIYSTVLVLGNTVADRNGTAVANLQIPAEFAGTHTLVAAGMSPSLTAMYLEAPISVVQPPAPDNPDAGPKPPAPGEDPAPLNRLETTGGSPLSLNRLGAVGLSLLAFGSLISIVAIRRLHLTSRRR